MALRELIYNSLTYSISYEILNQNKSDTILFLHGWGSNKEIMKQAFGNELKEFRLIFLDLPGFGGSSITKPIRTDELCKNCKIIFKFLKYRRF